MIEKETATERTPSTSSRFFERARRTPLRSIAESDGDRAQAISHVAPNDLVIIDGDLQCRGRGDTSPGERQLRGNRAPFAMSAESCRNGVRRFSGCSWSATYFA